MTTGPADFDGEEHRVAAAGDGSRRAEQQIKVDGGQNVWNIFNDRLDIHEAWMGIAGAHSQRRLTGPLLQEHVQHVLRRYVSPDGFVAAQRLLRLNRILILQGPEGIGKRTGALALLDAQRLEGEIVALSPALRMDEIARNDFKPGRGYVVQDWAGEPSGVNSLAFSLQALRSMLAEKGAYLVITTGESSHGGSLRDFAVRWEAPDSTALVDAYLRDQPIDAETRLRIGERFAACRTPRTIADFADRSAGASADRLEELLLESERDEVARCFDDDPDAAWVAFVAALAFMHGLRESAFERALATLRKRLWQPRPHVSDLDEDDGEPALEGVLEQTRSIRAQMPLVAVREAQRDGTAAAPGRRLAFASATYRERVLEELWRRYDHQFWDPVIAWLKELVKGDDTETQLSVSAGVALLAGAAAEEVRAELLEAWAAGDHNERVVASYAIWWLALRDASAVYALATATDWAQGSNAERKATAILCLSGELGVRFPGEAFRWLWHLSHSDPGTADLGRRAIAGLFRACAAAADEPDPSVLSHLATRLRGVRAPGASGTSINVVLRIINHVVTVQADREPAVAVLLGRKPAAAMQLGPLWAEALLSRPFRGEALSALRETLRSLHRAESTGAIAVLGQAIVAALPPHELPVLKRDLFHELKSGGGPDADSARSIIEVLLIPTAAHGDPIDESEDDEPLSDHR
jgi:hypothetical protein